MKFETLGNRNKPAIVAIHGMFGNAETLKPFASILAEDYYVILPTLDGHFPHSANFGTKEDQAGFIIDYLKKENIKKLAMVHGSSLGAVIALEMANRNEIPCQSYFMDSGLFFKYGSLHRNITYSKNLSLINSFRSRIEGTTSMEEADAALKGSMTEKLLGDGNDAYGGMVAGVSEVYRELTDETIHDVIEACYNCKLPKLPAEIQARCTFFYGERDTSAKLKKDLSKAYPKAMVSVFPKHGQCTFQMLNPEKYVDLLKMSII